MDKDYEFTYEQRIKIIKECLTEGQTPDAGYFNNPVEFGYTMACKNAIRLIDKYLTHYPEEVRESLLGKNDWQE